MQVPIRKKPGKYSNLETDPHITEARFIELKDELQKLKKNAHPRAASEVKRQAEFGDFSDNAAYSMAKGRLRWINQRISDLEKQLKNSIIIKPIKNAKKVELGNKVIIKIEGKEKTYLILGSSETDPAKNIISHSSPIGSALLDHKIGDRVKINLADKEIECEIIGIW
ncbi:GreA/GreB family elongation factor [Patescibacteria group bacterium]|nr:GreA/GreB family elongation factor [Patescibacteria group bacterium]